MRIVMLMASATDPHYHKRFNAFKENGYDIEAYGFKRTVSLSQFIPEDIVLLPKVENRNYLKRIRTVFSAVSKIISIHGKEVVYYATTFDIALVCCIKKVSYIYGISDLVHSNFPKLLRKPFIQIDRRIISKSICTVLTSEGFVSYLHIDKSQMEKCVFVKNKLDNSFLRLERPVSLLNKNYNGLRFGFAGNIRYETTLRFADLIGRRFPQYSFIFWGNGSNEMLERVQSLCSLYDNVFYNGPFSNPKDLNKIYESIDVMACNYDTHTINERLLEPNKLYECIFYNKPLIVTNNTFLGDTIKKLNIGTTTDNSEEDLNGVITDLSPDLINKWMRNEKSIRTIDLIEDFTPFFDKINIKV